MTRVTGGPDLDRTGRIRGQTGRFPAPRFDPSLRVAHSPENVPSVPEFFRSDLGLGHPSPSSSSQVVTMYPSNSKRSGPSSGWGFCGMMVVFGKPVAEPSSDAT